MGTFTLLLLASKPLIYGWVFALAWRWIPRERRPSRWSLLWAPLLRSGFALGLGIPLFAAQATLGPATVLAAACVLRWPVWLLCGALFLEPLGEPRLKLFALAGVALDALFDLSLRPQALFLL